MFIMYLTELICYMSEKISAKESVENSPIIKQLLILKGLIEKSKVIDMKLKPQIDRLLSIKLEKYEKRNKGKDVDKSKSRDYLDSYIVFVYKEGELDNESAFKNELEK